MRLHPNPPRMVTVVVVALGVIGVVLAVPIGAGVDLLRPITDVTAGFGLGPTVQTGWLALFVSSGLLVLGSLVPGI